MTRIRRSNHAEWTTSRGDIAEYDIHPGSVLSKHMEWSRSQDGHACIFGPEPDNINVAVLAPYIITLGLEHEYYYRVKNTRQWVSCGVSEDTAATLASVTRPIIAQWSTIKVRPLRPVKYPRIPDNIMSRDLPRENCWQWNDIGNY